MKATSENDKHIRQLYQWTKRLEIPMTHLINALLAHAIERLEEGVEYVSVQPARGSPRKQRKKQRRGMENESTRVALLEGLLGDCVLALEALLTSPDLNLDCLEPTTRDAIEVAQETLQAVQTVLGEE